MIKSYTVTTTEIDDGEEAAAQIAGQIASLPLLGNSMGIILAHPEFAASAGDYGRIAASFPFPVVGKTSITHYAAGAAETYMLSALVLTSDDCEFSCAASDFVIKDGRLAGDIDGVTRAAYGKARGKLAGEPKLAFLYGPFFRQPYLSDCIASMTGASGGVPIFGAAANDDQSSTIVETGARVFFGAEAYGDRFALALVSGAVDPRFYVVSATEESMVMPRVGVVTKAGNSRMMEINNVGAADFLKSVGFVADDPSSGLLSSIFIFHIDDGNGGVRVSRIPHGVDGGSILCGGDVVEGAVLSIAFNTREVVLETAKMAADRITANHEGGTAIIHTCLGRRYGLLSEPMAEMNLLDRELGGKFNCFASYANGEICPTSVAGGRADNRFHNQTLVACVL